MRSFSLRHLVFHGIMVDVELCQLSLIFPTQSELELLPGVILTNFVFLCIEKTKVSRPPGGIRTHVAILILHLVESEVVLGHFRPFTEVQRQLVPKTPAALGAVRVSKYPGIKLNSKVVIFDNHLTVIYFTCGKTI